MQNTVIYRIRWLTSHSSEKESRLDDLEGEQRNISEENQLLQKKMYDLEKYVSRSKGSLKKSAHSLIGSTKSK